MTYEPRQMTQAELAVLGISQMAYVRPIVTDGALTYAIHAADGTAIAVMDDLKTAVATIVDNDLIPVPIH